MVAPLWRGVDRIVVDCAGIVPSSARLCAIALAEARRGAALPVVGGDIAPRRNDARVRVSLSRDPAGGTELLVSIERGIVMDESEGILAARPFALASRDDAAFAAAIRHAFNAALPGRAAAARDHGGER